MWPSSALLVLSLGSPAASAQEPDVPPPVASIEVTLEALAPSQDRGLRWSPKAESVPLERAGALLLGEFQLGPAGTLPVRVVLARSEGAEHVDRLLVDENRNGGFEARETREATPREQRGKWWSSFEAIVDLPYVHPDGVRHVAYPLSLWFVEDPQEPDQQLALRWCRRGWFEGTFQVDGRPAYVLVSELAQDGRITRDDVWMLARERADLYATVGRGLARHAWLDGVAYRVTALAEDGSSLTFEPFDAGLTEAEEAAREDVLRADREAPRAAAPLEFGHDLAVALATAKSAQKRVFVDFETTWCGPCKQMDQLVYTAADVVAAASGVVAVKVDGDVARELVKRYEVTAYPTLLVLDADGNVLRRSVGYTSVADTARFLRD